MICCVNSIDTIEPAIRSAKWADEVVVVDSGSTDGTDRVAKELADKFVHEPWRGSYTSQKQFGTDQCRNDWVFILDADEECSEALAKEMQALTDEELEGLDLLLMPRENYVLGRVARSWGPDFGSRLFHRKRCTWGDHVLHDIRHPSSPSRQRKLKHPIIHRRYSKTSIKELFDGAKADARLLVVARQMHEKGKRCHWWDLVFRPTFVFLKHYLLKREVFAGTYGLILSKNAAYATYLKYAALWVVQKGLADHDPK